jgi:Condensation domain
MAGMPDAGPPMPLAPSQELMWEFMSALSPGDPTAAREIAAGHRRLHGDIEPAAFRAAVAEVTRRHEALRLVFAVVDHDPLVRVEPELEPPVSVVDLSGLPPDLRDQRVDELLRADRRLTFDLVRGPLWRLHLVRLSPGEHVLAYAFCHLIADGWACHVFVDELVRAYRARIGHSVPPAARAPSFAEVAELQRGEFPDPRAAAAYWRRELTPLPPYLPFPPRTVPPDADVVAEAAVPVRFPPETAQRLRRLAWRLRTTPYAVLMAAYHVLVALRTGTDRVVIGTTTLGRTSHRARQVVGQFTNDLYVSVRISARASLGGTVTQVHRRLAAAEEHAMPYRSLAAAVNPDFAGRRPWPDNHLFHSYLQAVQPAPRELTFVDLCVRNPGPGRRPEPSPAAVLPARDVPADRLGVWAKRGAPIMLIDDDRGGGSLVYNPAFYDQGMVRQLAVQYQAVVAALAGDPDRRVGTLERLM